MIFRLIEFRDAPGEKDKKRGKEAEDSFPSPGKGRVSDIFLLSWRRKNHPFKERKRDSYSFSFSVSFSVSGINLPSADTLISAIIMTS